MIKCDKRNTKGHFVCFLYIRLTNKMLYDQAKSQNFSKLAGAIKPAFGRL